MRRKAAARKGLPNRLGDGDVINYPRHSQNKTGTGQCRYLAETGRRVLSRRSRRYRGRARVWHAASLRSSDVSQPARSISTHGIERCKLLKMDCEGAEWEIIRQTDPQQFARFQAVVAEVHDDPEHKQSVTEFKQSYR